jgi:hypothetical protein
VAWPRGSQAWLAVVEAPAGYARRLKIAWAGQGRCVGRPRSIFGCWCRGSCRRAVPPFADAAGGRRCGRCPHRWPGLLRGAAFQAIHSSAPLFARWAAQPAHRSPRQPAAPPSPLPPPPAGRAVAHDQQRAGLLQGGLHGDDRRAAGPVGGRPGCCALGCFSCSARPVAVAGMPLPLPLRSASDHGQATMGWTSCALRTLGWGRRDGSG